MKIVKTVKVELTDEEREVIAQAQKILLDFEMVCSVDDEETLESMYNQKLGAIRTTTHYRPQSTCLM